MSLRQNLKSEDEIQKEELLRMGVYLRDLLEKNNVWHCLAFGSMLGAVRHNGFIPWDTDLDFHINITDRDRVRELIINNPPADAYLRVRGQNHTTESHDLLISKKVKKCHVDIYQLIGVPDNSKKRKVFCYLCYLCDMAFRHKHIRISDCLEKNRKKAFVVKALMQIIPDLFIEFIYRKLETQYDFNKSKYIKSLCSVYVPHDCLRRDLMKATFHHDFEEYSFLIPKHYDYYLKHMYGDYMTPKRY